MAVLVYISFLFSILICFIDCNLTTNFNYKESKSFTNFDFKLTSNDDNSTANSTYPESTTITTPFQNITTSDGIVISGYKNIKKSCRCQAGEHYIYKLFDIKELNN